MNEIKDLIYDLSKTMYQKELGELNVNQLHNVVSLSVMRNIADVWKSCSNEKLRCKRAYYLSAEFLVGRAIYNNLYCTGLYDEISKLLDENGADISCFEEIEDAALGNGGLGRLAACYLDSAASCGIPLDGYGIRYGFGLFKQSFDDGFQSEELDDWRRFGDPWSVRRDEDSVTVHFSDFDVVAVPYDMPVIGWRAKHISTLRLWQAEAQNEFDFELFNEQEYSKALELKNSCENISRVLYPNDSKADGKILRLRQQYFFSSASLQDMLKRFKLVHGNSFEELPDYISIQLNDTHPVIAIPELIRLLMLENMSFDSAFEISQRVFNYTNHTIMQEALEKWDAQIIEKISPEILNIIKKIDKIFNQELESMKITDKNALSQLKIIQDTTVHMAHLACRCCAHINGVARLHTQILKTDVLKCWYVLYPEKFVNITNGITQRRWLGLCNRPLSALISSLLGNDEWLTNLERLGELKKFADDKSILDEFISAKNECKKELADYIYAKDGVRLDSSRIIDVQIKRLHEYKRQLLNIVSILEIYFEIKEKKLVDFIPTVFIFGAKSAPGYFRAKAVIKLINEVSRLIDADKEVSKYISIIFVSNYNVSYAERIIAGADVSEQISTAGTEASGTGNMKLMLNGAVTLGTYDGANIEIVAKAGKENNYIFGATVEDINDIEESYNPVEIYNNDYRIKRCLDALVDGTLDDGDSGMFKELYDSILKGAEWHSPDQYYLLLDFNDYLEARLRLNRDYADRYSFAKKCWLNMCNAGKFSSDRAVREYARLIWDIKEYE